MANSSGSLTCIVCGSQFTRTGSRGPVPKYCSAACSAKKQRERPERREYERLYRAAKRRSGALKQYEWEYNRRPEVKERNRQRMMFKWHNDPEYRAKQLARWAIPYPDVQVNVPYTGHRWLEMARKAVTEKRSVPLDDSAPWADDAYDDMGAALIALLEGRDMQEAIAENRKREYVNRNLMTYYGDWRDDDGEDKWFEKQMPTVQSAEDEYFESEPIVFYEKTRFRNVHTFNRGMKNKQSSPSNRRSNRR